MVDNKLRKETPSKLVSLVNAFGPPLIMLTGLAIQGYLARKGLPPSGWAVFGLSLVWGLGIYNITEQPYQRNA